MIIFVIIISVLIIHVIICVVTVLITILILVLGRPVVQVKSPSSSGVSRGFQPCVSRRPPAGKRGRTARRVLGLLRFLRFLRCSIKVATSYYMKKDS